MLLSRKTPHGSKRDFDRAVLRVAAVGCEGGRRFCMETQSGVSAVYSPTEQSRTGAAERMAAHWSSCSSLFTLLDVHIFRGL